jgi:hypothetical protein
MHPDVIQKEPGTCSRCGMKLVAGDPWNEREYALELETTPAVAKPGDTVTFRIAVRDPDTREPVKDFSVVHDRQFHLFVISQDLEDFAHIHPAQDAHGVWTIEHKLSRPGFYRIYCDFLPVGGTPQVLARTIATAGVERDLSAAIPKLAVDRTLSREVDGTAVELQVQPLGDVVAGRTIKLQYQLASKGSPVTDLEPYLAAWGHALVLSEDALEVVHAHPIEYLPTNVTDPRGGPTITFDATFPKPGRYRVWMQFKRRDVVSTVPFTVEAVPPQS